MRKLLYKLKPQSGLSHTVHLLLNGLLPIIVLILINLHFTPIAAALVLLSKWRMFAVRPRYWLANIKSNLVDLFVGLSMVAFIAGTKILYTQLLWTIFYIFWLVWLKSKSKPLAVMAQALIAQALGLVAFYKAFPNSSIFAGIIITWLVCYAAARHFLGAFDEPLQKPITHIWAWFGAVMAWILGHWVIDYLLLPQIALVLTVIGYSLATLYYLHQKEKLTQSLKMQLIGVMGLLILIIIVFSDWQDKTI